jgi:predicted nucleic acid-binding protein
VKDKLFVDTNVIIDLIGRREPFFESAFDLFTLALEKKIELYVSSVSYCTVNYILRKHLSHQKLMTTFNELERYVKILNVDDKVVKHSCNSMFTDFEDAIQYYSITDKSIKTIITRDKKDFSKGVLSVMTAADYLKARS